MDISTTQRGSSSYELRFAGLFNVGRGYAFPCDAEGLVDIDCLSELARANYFYARTSVGREFFAPVTCPCDRCDLTVRRDLRRPLSHEARGESARGRV